MTNEADTGMNTDNRVIVAVSAIKADVLRIRTRRSGALRDLSAPPWGVKVQTGAGEIRRSFRLWRRNWDQNAFRRIGGANLNKRSAGFVATHGLSQK
jgi:hypothetical protein